MIKGFYYIIDYMYRINAGRYLNKKLKKFQYYDLRYARKIIFMSPSIYILQMLSLMDISFLGLKFTNSDFV